MELLWRRTQQPETKVLSGLGTENDRRRRIIHGLDTYAVIQSGEGYSLAITDPYIWFQVASPPNETSEYLKMLQRSLDIGHWVRESGGVRPDIGIYQLGDLKLKFEVKEKEDEDVVAGRIFPLGYNILEMEINGGKEKDELKRKNQLQVELGCGLSIEAGIPPLHYFHSLYQVSEPIKGTLRILQKGSSFIFCCISC